MASPSTLLFAQTGFALFLAGCSCPLFPQMGPGGLICPIPPSNLVAISGNPRTPVLCSTWGVFPEVACSEMVIGSEMLRVSS